MAEPGLSEIISISAQAGTPTGTPAVDITKNNAQLLQTLNENARFKAENDWRKYNTFLGNLKEVYSDLGQIQGMDVATQDREMLRSQAADIFKDIAENPRAFFGGSKMGEIQAKLANLRGLSEESKQNRLYDFAHRQYVEQNPELNNPDNKKLIDEYWKQPLGKRNPYMLNMPTVFDARAYSKEIQGLPSVTQKFSETGLVGAGGQPGNEFIRELAGTRTSKDRFMQQWMAGLNTEKDKYGHSIRSAVEQQFNQLPDSVKKQLGSAENYFYNLGLSAFGSDKDIVEVAKNELKPNEFAKMGIEQKQRIALEAIKFGHDKTLTVLQHNLSTMPTPQQTQFVLGMGGDLLKNTTGEKINVGKGDEEVIDAAVPIKQLFAKKIKTTTKEGLTTESAAVTTPDVLTRLSDGSMRTVFYKKDATGDIAYNTGKKTAAEIKKEADKEGISVDDYKKKNFKPIVESSEVVSPKEYTAILAKEFLDKKDVAGVSDQVNKILNEYGGNILNYVDQNKPKDENQSQQKTAIPTPSNNQYSAKMQDGTLIYSNDGKTWYNKKGKKVE